MNQSKNKALIFIIAVLLIANIATLVYFIGFRNVPGRGSRGDKRGGGMVEFLRKDVGFDAHQLSAFDSLKQKHRTEMKPLFEALGKSKDSLYHLLSLSSVPDSEVQKAAAQVGKRQAEIEWSFFRNFSGIRDLCTDKQKPVFDSLVPGALKKMMMMPQRKGGPLEPHK